jgi:hypothetical protein
VICEEGRGGGLPLLLVGQRSNSGPQLADDQVLAAHRRDAIRSRWPAAAQGMQRAPRSVVASRRCESARGRAVDIDDRRAVAGADHDDPTLLVAGVTLPVDRALGHVQEVAPSCLEHLGATRP